MQLLYRSRKKIHYIYKISNKVIRKQRWKDELLFFHTNFRVRLYTYMLSVTMCKIFPANIKRSKIGQNHRSLIFAFTFFLIALTNISAISAPQYFVLVKVSFVHMGKSPCTLPCTYLHWFNRKMLVTTTDDSL